MIRSQCEARGSVKLLGESGLIFPEIVNPKLFEQTISQSQVFAMPETALGLFPDVGASYYLSRLPGFFEIEEDYREALCRQIKRHAHFRKLLIIPKEPILKDKCIITRQKYHFESFCSAYFRHLTDSSPSSRSLYTLQAPSIAPHIAPFGCKGIAWINSRASTRRPALHKRSTMHPSESSLYLTIWPCRTFPTLNSNERAQPFSREGNVNLSGTILDH
ncbi:3-hydroxyisobutyryl-CoA hydrolase 1 [Cucurbita argyrosperma subsp. argyrosperma]|nr:3-hydroxyisobutyryl-CoA hydrolase 1 [Cucurbita argyrosperma subsp. argyrosperma]